MPIQIARQPHTQLPPIHPIVLSASLQIQSHRRGDNAVCSGPNQLFVQRVTKPAALIHRVDRVTLGNLFFHPGQQLGSGELLRRSNQTPLTLYRRHNVAQVHVQTEPEVQPHCAVASAHRVVSILSVMKGWSVFHTRRVPVLPTLYNPSWHLTPSELLMSLFAVQPSTCSLPRSRRRGSSRSRLGPMSTESAANTPSKVSRFAAEASLEVALNSK